MSATEKQKRIEDSMNILDTFARLFIDPPNSTILSDYRAAFWTDEENATWRAKNAGSQS